MRIIVNQLDNGWAITKSVLPVRIGRKEELRTSYQVLDETRKVRVAYNTYEEALEHGVAFAYDRLPRGGQFRKIAARESLGFRCAV